MNNGNYDEIIAAASAKVQPTVSDVHPLAAIMSGTTREGMRQAQAALAACGPMPVEIFARLNWQMQLRAVLEKAQVAAGREKPFDLESSVRLAESLATTQIEQAAQAKAAQAQVLINTQAAQDAELLQRRTQFGVQLAAGAATAVAVYSYREKQNKSKVMPAIGLGFAAFYVVGLAAPQVISFFSALSLGKSAIRH